MRRRKWLFTSSGDADLKVLVFLFAFLLVLSDAKKRLHITDFLDDVVDDEEDDAWREWGKKWTNTPPPPELELPPDFTGMTPEQIQAEMVKRDSVPPVGFVKLKLGVKRSRDDVPMLAMRWTQILRTGSLSVRFMAVDLNTIMFNMEKGEDVEELKDFILSQREAYEVKIGAQVYRRPGDPPLEEVIEMLQKEKANGDSLDAKVRSSHGRDEL